MTPLTTLKIAVFAPMPSASVTITMNVKPGFLSRVRAPKRMSCQSISMESSFLFRAQRNHWINFRCPPCRKKTGQQCYGYQQHRDARKGQRIGH